MKGISNQTYLTLLRLLIETLGKLETTKALYDTGKFRGSRRKHFEDIYPNAKRELEYAIAELRTHDSNNDYERLYNEYMNY